VGQANDDWQGKGTMDATAEQGSMNGKKDAQRSVGELFRFSTWVHVGTGAKECEQGEDGRCDDPRHFHAWCRLPNQFQHADIRERAMAAKARRMRQLRDPNTDAYEVLEAELDDLLREGDKAEMVEELLSRDWWKRHLEAMAEIEEDEDFKTMERDRERMTELTALDEADRPKDEYEELTRHMGAYDEAVEKARAKLEKPLRESFEGMEPHELVEQIRLARMASEASSAFLDTYSKWEWMAGTFFTEDNLHRKLRFAAVDELEAAAPEVIEALRMAYAELEANLQRGAQGN
jgi:hypothetical protein